MSRRLIYAVGDVHGRFDLLEQVPSLVDGTHSDSDKMVVFLGDLIDRGPQSRECVEMLMEWTQNPACHVVLCNHAQMLMAAVEAARAVREGRLDELDTVRWWWRNGGKQTAASYGHDGDALPFDPDLIPEAQLEWMRERPWQVQTDHHVFVHAGIRPGVSLEEQTLEDLTWIRDEFSNCTGETFEKHVVHGHTPKERPELLPHRTNLDTGACWTGVLSVGVFDADQPGGPLEVYAITVEGIRRWGAA